MPKRKCKECKDYVSDFIKVPAGVFCNIDHAILFANNKTKARKAKAWRTEKKARKDKSKTLAQWLNELQVIVNKYVRLRDRNEGCISCDKPSTWGGQWHCSHYFSRGHSSSLRFNLWNMHKSCSVCNSHLSGNIGEYTPRIISKIGEARYEYLVNRKSDVSRFEIEHIKRAIKVA